MTIDHTLARIGHGVELHHHRGEREAARLLFAQIWDEIGGEQGDPLHVCVLAAPASTFSGRRPGSVSSAMTSTGG